MVYDIKLGTRVVMCIPTLSKNPRTPLWIDGMGGLQMPLGSSLGRKWRTDKPIAQAREELCVEAISMDAEYIFFLGDDVIPPPSALLTLLEKIGHTFTNRDGEDQIAQMITGIYWTKTYPPEPYIFRRDAGQSGGTGLLTGTYRNWVAGEFFDVDIAGCDCLLIETRMLKEIPRPWFSTDWIWEPGQKPSSIATEDYYFYTKAREYGFRIWADTSIECWHEDRDTGATFGLTLDMVQAGSVPTVGNDEVLVADLGAGLSSEGQGLFGPKAKIMRFDSRESVKPDIRCDIRHLDDHFYGKFDFVNASHVLEHFRRNEAIPTVREWIKLLKPGGTIIIHVPNFERAVNFILNPPEGAMPDDKNYAWAQVYGDQAEAGPAWQHLNGFTARKLEMLLRSIPELTDVKVEYDYGNDQNLRGTAKLVAESEPYTLIKAWKRILDKETPRNVLSDSDPPISENSDTDTDGAVSPETTESEVLEVVDNSV